MNSWQALGLGLILICALKMAHSLGRVSALTEYRDHLVEALADLDELQRAADKLVACRE